MSAALWWVLTALAVLATLANALSLVQGFRLTGHVRRGLRTSFGAYAPRVAVILPVRGLDEGFDENLLSILRQTYDSFRVLAVADDLSDPALARIRELARTLPQVRVDAMLADPTGTPGKVNALRTALTHVEPGDEVLVFADADIRPGPDWLHQLVQPLADVTVGVSTGFRWYVPSRASLWGLVRSEWNAVSANVLFDTRLNYAWGGSCAIRTEHLPRLCLEERWRDVLSDDLVLTQAVRSSGMNVVYSPAALVPTFEDADRATCVEWCDRQIAMASLYLPEVRRYAASAFAVFNGAVVLGVVALLLSALVSIDFLLPAALFLVTLPATAAKSFLRRRAFFGGSREVQEAWIVPEWRTALASLAVPWLMVVGLLRTRRLETVRWRGRTYDVRDPFRVHLVESEPIPR